MPAEPGKIVCDLYKSAFPSEVVFSVATVGGQSYEGVAPKHYAEIHEALTPDGVSGRLHVKVISNGGSGARVMVPDGEIIDVSGDTIELSL